MELFEINLKVSHLNIKHDMPTVDAATTRLKNGLTTFKNQGLKAVIVVHGFGSQGEGGSIKPAVRKLLADRSMCGIVRAYAGGEEWFEKKREILAICPGLKESEQEISGNEGITVVVMK